MSEEHSWVVRSVDLAQEFRGLSFLIMELEVESCEGWHVLKAFHVFDLMSAELLLPNLN